jgi:acetolactate synthase-1/3 small subunit
MKHMPAERHTLAITVANEPGVLARVVGLFSGRGYNIESLTVAEVAADHATSRITVVTSGPPPVIEQIIAQLGRLIPVHAVVDLTAQGPHVEREMALVRVAGRGEARTEALRLAQLFGARVVDATTTSFMFEISDTSERVDSFLALMAELGLAEVARTGVAALAREVPAGAGTAAVRPAG